MTQLERLYQAACDDDIHIYDYKFSKTKKAACVHDGGHKAIILDKLAIETNIEEKILLAEEICHYETGGLYMVDSAYDMPIARSSRMKYEAMAKRGAVEKLAPLDKLKQCFNNSIFDLHEIAEILDLTPEFVSYAINVYIVRNKLPVNLGDCYEFLNTHT